MSDIVISVENLSKSYRLGQINTGTLKDDLNVWWARVRGKPNPLIPIGQVDYGNLDGETIWALKNVNFQVERGEALGIIGSNGAGKSTLLKVLSRITAPTFGRVNIKGRIASLLEIGTGFHPEMTARENIFLNGAILGMTKTEVNRKFEQIVDFSGVEQFIDTPVKRYSSGMYVRLAFAVAAHLDPEILIVDEVLSVGDAEFQKKCLGKMGEIATEGRTVLFVSHNMQAVQNLCENAILMDHGSILTRDSSSSIISQYLHTTSISRTKAIWNGQNAPGNNWIRLLKAWIEIASPEAQREQFTMKDDLDLSVEFVNLNPGESNIILTIHLQDERGIVVFVTHSGQASLNRLTPGKYVATCRIPGNLLNQGTYTVSRLIFVKDGGFILYKHKDILVFDVTLPDEKQYGWMGKKEGVVRPNLDWSVKRIE
jgi:lipopolysaccharide transport system ATP-binding protein